MLFVFLERPGYVPLLMSAVVVFLVGGRSKAAYTVVPGLHTGDGTSRGWV
jgi:hypothetical protein